MPIVRYVHVTKEFAPEAFGVKDVNLEIEPGELVVITGRTGSGKTTLMKLLTREYEVTEGELYFNDTPVHELKTNKLHLHRRQIGVVYQDYRLIKELTVWENVALPLYIAGKKEDEVEQRTSDLLSLIKLSHKYESFPNQLSGGEAQRVSIARSLALAPDLIFADEPTGNLDSETSRGIALLLAKINELGTTVLLSTHDLTMLDVFTNERHIQLENGSIVKNNKSSSKKTPAEVETKPKAESTKAAELEESEAKSDNSDAEQDTSKLETESESTLETENPVETQPKPRTLWHRLTAFGQDSKKKVAQIKSKIPSKKSPVSDSPSDKPVAEAAAPVKKKHHDSAKKDKKKNDKKE
ncbi:ATP-binding cassette domain-containing protein [Candidatus Woesebacteria bacterium]|nr:ATP-binding cassette domain-containing protein [Candidatus Woesebacteria bacterium]